jgi:DNA-binding SARP family transcriptional activator
MQPAVAHVQLLGQFQLVVGGRPVHIPLGAQHLLAMLALNGALVRRPLVAGTLWPEKGDGRATANLRSSLWRVGQLNPDLINCTDGVLGLASSVSVDLGQMLGQARRLLDGGACCEDSDLVAGPLLRDLLPDWYEDWVLVERERIRQVRMHALEALCERLTALERFSEAIDAGLAAVAAEPLRESAHLALMRAYQAEGNRCEVLRAYDRLRRLLRSELGVEPSGRVEDFVRHGPVTVG